MRTQEVEKGARMIEKQEETIEQQLAALANDKNFEWIQKQSKPYLKLMSYYKCAMMEIETKFKVLNEEYMMEYDRNPISSIQTRLKRTPNIIDKLNRQQLPLTLDSIEKNLYDISGVRVICSFREDVYSLADSFLKQDDITLLQKKDYIENPKPNGYRSLHLIVLIPIFLAHEKREMVVEVQIRTIAMDFWASLEHQIHYKKNVKFTAEHEAELSECARISAALDMRMDNLRKSTLQRTSEE